VPLTSFTAAASVIGFQPAASTASNSFDLVGQRPHASGDESARPWMLAHPSGIFVRGRLRAGGAKKQWCPGAESNIERKALIHNAFLNEISACANTSTNTISALKNRGFDSRR